MGWCAQADDWRSAKAIYDFHALDIDGNDVSLEKYRGDVWKTAVNYTQLVDMHARYAEKGLRILGFPCNQFGKQEPGDNAQIKAFAENYGVKFDMYSKIDVNGDDAHPLWKWMKEQPKGRGTLGKPGMFSGSNAPLLPAGDREGLACLPVALLCCPPACHNPAARGASSSPMKGCLQPSCWWGSPDPWRAPAGRRLWGLWPLRAGAARAPSH
uniref:phospholipid-hydroperoxide glutathione peroxidase n=1 Tax=Catharus ustulatus TaxID=91951 RepID=A0A8C3U8T1_CATUS